MYRGPAWAQGAPTKDKATKKATAAKNAPKGKRGAKTQEATAPREGSKTAQVVTMLQRKNGATLAEIMEKMGWQKHTVRDEARHLAESMTCQQARLTPAGITFHRSSWRWLCLRVGGQRASWASLARMECRRCTVFVMKDDSTRRVYRL
jgi:hypothetical protein